MHHIRRVLHATRRDSDTKQFSGESRQRRAQMGAKKVNLGRRLCSNETLQRHLARTLDGAHITLRASRAQQDVETIQQIVRVGRFVRHTATSPVIFVRVDDSLVESTQAPGLWEPSDCEPAAAHAGPGDHRSPVLIRRGRARHLAAAAGAARRPAHLPSVWPSSTPDALGSPTRRRGCAARAAGPGGRSMQENRRLT